MDNVFVRESQKFKGWISSLLTTMNKNKWSKENIFAGNLALWSSLGRLVSRTTRRQTSSGSMFLCMVYNSSLSSTGTKPQSSRGSASQTKDISPVEGL
jgi:hypothetical protein